MREGAVLQNAQQLRLQWPAHVPNLIEENRPAIGLLDSARLLFDRAGEGPLFMPKKFAFQKCLRNGRAIDAHVGVLPSLAEAVQSAGNQFLSGAAFAQD